MSIDCRMSIRRKCDDREIAMTWCNAIRPLLDDYSEKFKREPTEIQNNSYSYHYRCDSSVFNDIYYDVKLKLKQLEDRIFEKKLMIPACANTDVKHEIEEDIAYMQSDDMKYYENQAWAAAYIEGMICALVEDNIDMSAKDGENTVCASEYNVKDLPKTKFKHSDGTEYESSPRLYIDDVYCVIEFF